MTTDPQLNAILHSLQERAKELNCLYEIDAVLSEHAESLSATLDRVAAVLPPGWQFPEVCMAAVVLDGRVFGTLPSDSLAQSLQAPILQDGLPAGEVVVWYREPRPAADEGPFLQEERKLINTVAGRVAHYLQQEGVRGAHDTLARAIRSVERDGGGEWRLILDFLRRADPPLLATITRKMINQLCWSGVEEAVSLLSEFISEESPSDSAGLGENRPVKRSRLKDAAPLANRTFEIAERHCTRDEMVSRIRSWIEEDKAAALVEVLESRQSSVSDISSSLDRFALSGQSEDEIPTALRTSLGASLFLRRFFSDDLGFLGIMKDRVRVEDFHDLVGRIVHSANSRGRLGGKSTGLFLASTVLRGAEAHHEQFGRIRTPKTWYVSSDTVLEFIRHNNLDDVHAHKYRDIERIRTDYPHLIQVFKNSAFPVEVSNGLAVALDDFGDNPIIVRSSSLLEDRIGASFSGKYKSLFLANQGTKRERLAALQDAIAEVYASIFGPDPIAYRAERGLLDVHEEMAIMIQQVVGVRAGKYFLPSYAGVAYARNEFRWSPRIKREDGVVRLVLGLGTRAVDRLNDDYPVLMAPGQPGLRVNVSVDETVRYAPRKVDLINLDDNEFQTVDLRDLLREIGDDLPEARRLVSLVTPDRVRAPSGLEPDWEQDHLVVTFDGLIREGSFVRDIRLLLDYLSRSLGYAVDLEFASDGTNLYLLQCRAQSASPNFESEAIPAYLPPDATVFNANRYVSNGVVPDVTHIVYVDPEAYSKLPDLSLLHDVARAVGRLNKLLPRRKFVLIGPGRWGSRGDIKLGVGVTYGDINNTSALIEVAWRQGNYDPELSFGTHFFQDLVEADIRYLPLYPEDEGVIFNRSFLLHSDSSLADLLPEYAHLEGVLRVVDVPSVADGRILRVMLNADLNRGVGLLTLPSMPRAATGQASAHTSEPRAEPPSDPGRWRILMAERIAALMDATAYGVKALYLTGSSLDESASLASDIDLVVHFDGSADQRGLLTAWLDGWSRALAAENQLRTGHETDQLLDVHFVTDLDLSGNPPQRLGGGRSRELEMGS